MLSNIFMTFAWYAHLRNLANRPWYLGIRQLGDRAVRVPASGAGQSDRVHNPSLSQLKILQEVITLVVFVPFAVLYMRQPLKLDYLWAAICLMGVVYFIFRSPQT